MATDNNNTMVYTSIALALTSSLIYVYYQYNKKKVDKKKKSAKTNKQQKQQSLSKAFKNDNDNDDDDDDVDSSMKGYKITSDGFKTSYFTRELSEDEKKILGDCTPQLISSSGSISSEPRLISTKEISTKSETTNNGSSAWNSAGTFEERYYSDFAEQQIKRLLQGLVYKSPEGAVISILNLKNVTGDALLTFSRGRSKHIYDFEVNADFKIFEPRNGNVLVGTINIDNITGDCDYEINTKIDNNTNNNFYKKYVQSSSTGLQPLITKSLDKFLEDFKDHTATK